MTTVFISHSSADTDAVLEVRDCLVNLGHVGLFLDIDPQQGLVAGEDWEKALYRELKLCRALLILCSPASMSSKWCFAEIAHAKSMGKPVIPIQIAPCELDSTLRNFQAIDWTQDPLVARERLAKGLEAIGIRARDSFDWNRQRPPYPGLLSYQEEDAAVYFGREDAISEALESLNKILTFNTPATLLCLGPSGSGKSSFVRAGVLPRLKKEPERWIVLEPILPRTSCSDQLVTAISRYLPIEKRSDFTHSVQQAIREIESPAGIELFKECARRVRDALGTPGAAFVVTIDQAEELLLDDDHQAFARSLVQLQSIADPQLIFILTLRSDYLSTYQRHAILQQLRTQTFMLDPIDYSGIRKIIEGPAALAGITLESRLVEQLIADTETKNALPLLAFTLRELYERYASDQVLDMAEYQALGGLSGSVAKAADAVLAAADPDTAQLQHLKQALMRLVRIDDEGNFTRQRAELSELPVDAQPLLDRFVAARLLVAAGESDSRTLEVAHEAIFTAWKQYQLWLDEDHEFLLWHRRFSQALTEWERTDHHVDTLLKGPAVHEARRWRDSRETAFSPPELQFLAASATAATRRRTQFAAFFMTFVALLAAATVFSLYQRSEAIKAADIARLSQRSAEEKQTLTLAVAAESQLEINQHFDDFIALTSALKAGTQLTEMSDAPAALAADVTVALHRVVYGVRERQRLTVSAMLETASFDDQSNLSAITRDGMIKRWNRRGVPLTTDASLMTVIGPDGVIDHAVFTRNDRHVFVVYTTTNRGGIRWSSPRRLIEWDIEHGQVVRELFNGSAAQLSDLVVAEDGSVVLTAGNDGVRVWHDGEPVELTLQGAEGRFTSIARSASGTWIAALNDPDFEINGDERVLVWSANGELYRQRQSAADALNFFPGDENILLMGRSGQTTSWNLHSNEVDDTTIKTSVFNHNLQLVAASNDDGIPQVFTSQGELAATFSGHSGGAWPRLFHPQSDTLLTSGRDLSLRLWSLEPDQPRAGTLKDWRGGQFKLVFSPDSSYIATSETSYERRGNSSMPTIGRDNAVVIWDRNGLKLGEVPRRPGNKGLRQMVFDANGDRIALVESRSEASLWNWRTQTRIGPFTPPDGLEIVAALFKDNRAYLVLKNAHTVQIVDWMGERVGEIPMPAARTAIGIAEIAGQLTTLTGNTASLWNLDGTQVASFSGEIETNAKPVVSIGGKYLATQGQERIDIWDWSGRLQSSLPSANNISFTGPDHLLATSNSNYYDPNVTIWSVAGGSAVARFRANSLFDVALAPAGRLLGTVGNNGPSQLWRVESLQELMSRACDIAHPYLTTNPGVSPADRKLCDAHL